MHRHNSAETGFDEMMASVNNIVYGKAAFERSIYDSRGANASK